MGNTTTVATMRITDLNREQLIQVKQFYLLEREQRTGVSWAELGNADSLVSDEEVMREYADMVFSEKDFRDVKEEVAEEEDRNVL